MHYNRPPVFSPVDDSRRGVESNGGVGVLDHSGFTRGCQRIMLSTLGDEGSSTVTVAGGSTKSHMEKQLRVQWLSAAELEPLKPE